MVPPAAPTSTPPEATDPWAALLEAVQRGLAATVQQLIGGVAPPELADVLDTTGGADWDIALPCHRFAKAAGVEVVPLAERLAGAYAPPPEVVAATPVRGYVNLRIDADWLTDTTLALVFARGPAYGSANPSGAPVCVEHTSANPTGPLHIGRVRNGIIGDSLARILRAAGHHVTTQYYADDMGRQSAMISWIWSKPPSEWPEVIRGAVPDAAAPLDDDPRPDKAYGRPYPAVSAYLKEDREAAAEVAAIGERLETGEVPAEHRRLADRILQGMLASLERLHIEFDEVVWESGLLTDGSVAEVVRRLRAAPHAVTEENGALAIDATTYELPKDDAHVIVMRANGTSLYVTRDVAYHLAKFARFPRTIDVLGSDHLLHAKTLGALLDEIGEARRPEFVLYQLVALPGGAKMSTRGGSAVYLDTLLDEAVVRARAEVLQRREDLATADVDAIAESVGVGSVRYHIARVAPDKAVKFQWEEALSFEGRSGPFVQYAYARASSILRKAGTIPLTWTRRPSDLAAPEERALVRTISRLPGRVLYAAKGAHVHAIAGYAHDLAEEFNRFYQQVPVIRAGPERESRLALVQAARQTLANTLELLGLDSLEAM
ncbi:MAG TPA: arginine--tRNA ligase [Thermoplasmata archaeon]|nr:arginine--tRNA ligase [Thermoplasmata archaeon]